MDTADMNKRLEITAMVGCPLMCTYCPQKLLRSQYAGEKYMEPEILDIVLTKISKDVRIDFSGMAEPFANPFTLELMDLVLVAGHDIALYTTLYGLKQSDTDFVVRLLEEYASQVKVVCLHLPDAAGNMVGFKYTEDFQYALNAFLALGSKNLFPFECMAMGSLSPHLTEQEVTLSRFRPLDRAGTVDPTGVSGPTPRSVWKREPITCHKYYQNVLMPNGDVYLCCMDYGLKHRLGNLVEQSYADILVAANTIAQLNLVAGSNTICRKCARARSI
jgi:radical SAM protein with 4Fe4S-binding SPASM domain